MEIYMIFSQCTFKNLNRLFNKMYQLKFILRSLQILIRFEDKEIVQMEKLFVCLFKHGLKKLVCWIEVELFLCSGKTTMGHFIIQNWQWNWKNLGIYGSKQLSCPLWSINVCLEVGRYFFFQKVFFFKSVPANWLAETVLASAVHRQSTPEDRKG